MTIRLHDIAAVQQHQSDLAGLLFVTTAGAGNAERARALWDAGVYVHRQALAAVAIASAEATPEWLHAQLRAQWGFSDPPEASMMDRFQTCYRGKRYSFGYPVSPHLAGQVELLRMPRPEEIGVHLTEGHMMDPEASISALVFHHPDFTFFVVGKEAVEGMPAEHFAIPCLR